MTATTNPASPWPPAPAVRRALVAVRRRWRRLRRRGPSYVPARLEDLLTCSERITLAVHAYYPLPARARHYVTARRRRRRLDETVRQILAADLPEALAYAERRGRP